MIALHKVLKSVAGPAMILSAVACLQTPGLAADDGSSSEQTASAQVNSVMQPAVQTAVAGAFLKKKSDHEKRGKGEKGGFRGWLFKPILGLQDEVASLDEHIATLNGPMLELKPELLGLVKEISGVQKHTDNLEAQLLELKGRFGDTLKEMISLQSDLNAQRKTIGSLERPIADLKEPIVLLRTPVLSIRKPLINVDAHLAALARPVQDLKDPILQLQAPLAKIQQPLQGLDTRLDSLNSRLAALSPRFGDLDTRFTELDSRFTRLGKQLESLQFVLTAVLICTAVATSIITVLAIIAFSSFRKSLWRSSNDYRVEDRTADKVASKTR